MIPEVITIDFETEEIKPRPEYPPVPVGVAIDVPGERPRYLSWGHPTNNNCTKHQAKRQLLQLWKDKRPKLFHNSKFDYDVATTHLQMPKLNWFDLHDTLFLIFLQNPDRDTLSLKPVAEQVLGLKPVERDAVRQWLIDNRVCKKGDRKWGRFMARAPGDVVDKYSIGDVTRTRKLFNKYYQEVIVRRNMAEAYERERRLMLHLLEMERRGVRADVHALEQDAAHYTKGLEILDRWISRRLGVKYVRDEENGKSWVDSDDELSLAIQNAGAADLSKWRVTDKTGQYSTAKDALAEALIDKPLQAALAYRAPVATCLRTFIRPWCATAQRSGGMIFTNWNQVAQDYHESGARKGARTGRLSSNPNWQNIPTRLEEKDALVAAFLIMQKNNALRNIIAQWPVPLVRRYVLPLERGWVLNDRDINQQELRILAHFENGELKSAYEQDAWLDMHAYVQDIVSEMLHQPIGRKLIKVLNFGILYGQGIGKTAAGMKTDINNAKRIQSAHASAFPGIPKLIKELKARAKQNLPIRTWGGREYYCEPPKIATKGPRVGQLQTFEYKLINTLIQGSAADNTKEAMINYCETAKDGVLLLTVHDQLLGSAPLAARKQEMELLRKAISDCKFDVPMLSTGSWSRKNWTEMKSLTRGE